MTQFISTLVGIFQSSGFARFGEAATCTQS